MAFGKKKSVFAKLQEGLAKTTSGMMSKIEDVIFMRPSIDEEMMEELEEALILSDIGLDTSAKIIERLRSDIKSLKLGEPKQVMDQIKLIISELMKKEVAEESFEKFPLVILMVGVNGSGKTTSIAKLSHMFKEDGKTILVAAADTFRAAAIEQLEVWCKRVNVPIIKHQEGSDPSAVIFDAIKAAKARNIDVLICDTAGRLQNKKNLMLELEKMSKIIDREFPEAVKETLLVIDAGTGKNAISQAKEFGEVADITGIILTKLDGTAKGGIVITISDEFDIPVKFIGVGEGMDDLQPFDPETFAEALFSKEKTNE